VRAQPSVLVFDVNETLIDIDSIAPLFKELFGDERVLREWFGQLVMYSMTATLAGYYVDFFTLGQGVLHMLGASHRVNVTDQDVARLRDRMRTMPAHPDVAEGLAALRDKGFRLVTLTNSPHHPGSPTPLENAGLAGFFERQLSVDTCRAFKPAPAVYRQVCQVLEVAPADCMMVAAHVWDTLGAQGVGFSSALITRPGNPPLPVDGLPQPTLVAKDVGDLARQLTKLAR
jgi:2-haloacid dehalogenase